MAATVPNFDLILQGILRRARGMPDPMAWLTGQHGTALDAVMAGDDFVGSLSDEGGSTSSTREIPANVLLQLYELAIQELEAEDTRPASRTVRYGDFSEQPCVLG